MRRLALFLLLALTADTAAFALRGRLSEFIDSAAWLLLFALFLLETLPRRAFAGRSMTAVHLLRFLATAAVLWAAVAYGLEGEWADALQAWLWIGVVILLEVELRFDRPALRPLFVVAAGLLYGALLLFIPYWLWQGEWLDALDAALWLAAFFLLELDVLGRMSAPAPQRFRR